MSLYQCLTDLQFLAQHYPQHRATFIDYFQQLQKIAHDNQPLKLAALKQEIAQTFPDIANLPFYSPKRWLPLESYPFEQKLYRVLQGLSDCSQKARVPQTNKWQGLQLASALKMPASCSPTLRAYYQALHLHLNHLVSTNDIKQSEQQWQRFSKETAQIEQALESQSLSMLEQRHNAEFLAQRYAIQNQLAMQYIHLKNQKAAIDLNYDWRAGSGNHHGYGLVMAMALEGYNPRHHQRYTFDPIMAELEANQAHKTADQRYIQHNRLTATVVGQTAQRIESLIALAKQHPNSHLNIKLISRSSLSHKHSYLQYCPQHEDGTFYFADPDYGLYHFNNEQEFKFFYKMLYAKEQLQQGQCWNRFQVSQMRSAPEQRQSYSWRGKLRSLLYGLKYNRSPLDVTKSFLIFNLTMFLSLTVTYSLVGIIALFSPPVATLLFKALAHRGFSLLLGASFTFASAGLLSLPEFAKVIFDFLKDSALQLTGNAPTTVSLLSEKHEHSSPPPTFNSTHRQLLKSMPQEPEKDSSPTEQLSHSLVKAEIPVEPCCRNDAEADTLLQPSF